MAVIEPEEESCWAKAILRGLHVVWLLLPTNWLVAKVFGCSHGCLAMIQAYNDSLHS